MKEFFSRVAERRWASFLLLAVAGGLLSLPGTSTLPLMDRDEPKFAQATWEMMETEQFTIPYFNKGYRFDKPPLTYWWMRVHYTVLGKTELGARLHSVFAGILTAWIIYLFGSLLYSRVAGLLSGLAWLTCLQVLIHSRLCVADMPMLLGVTLTMYAIALLLFSEEEPKRFGGGFWLLVAGLVIGFLAKGPVAWIVPLLALLLWLWPVGKTRFAWRRLQPVSSLLIATAIVSIWGIKALMETRGQYWDVGVGEHVVKRGVSAFNGRVNIPIVYYLFTAVLSLLPWSAFLPGALFTSRAKLREDRKRSFLTAWFLAPFLVFSLYATQLPHYILPGFPAFMLLLFPGEKLTALDTKWRRRWFAGVVGLMTFLSLIMLVAGSMRIFPEPMAEVNRLVFLAGWIFLLVGVAFPVAIRMVGARPGRWPVFVVVALVAVGVAQVLTHGIREVHPIVRLKKEGVLSEDRETRFVAQGFAEPSWVFYHWNGNRWVLGGNVKGGAEFLAKDGGKREGIFLTEEWRIGELAILAKWRGEEIPHLQDQRKEVEAYFDNDRFTVTEVSGLNIARTSWVRLWHVRPKTP